MEFRSFPWGGESRLCGAFCNVGSVVPAPQMPTTPRKSHFSRLPSHSASVVLSSLQIMPFLVITLLNNPLPLPEILGSSHYPSL